MEHVLWNIFYERGHKYLSLILIRDLRSVDYGPKLVEFFETDQDRLKIKDFGPTRNLIGNII